MVFRTDLRDLPLGMLPELLSQSLIVADIIEVLPMCSGVRFATSVRARGLIDEFKRLIC
jgi:hypothetical protein